MVDFNYIVMNEIDMFVKQINKYYGNEDQNWRNFYFHGFQEIKYLKKMVKFGSNIESKKIDQRKF